ncbi:MAG TPA: hypothetical protein DCW86_02555 [Actinobacteria bacterium]|nr:hypothetical protein [Actinomycetota bacterium]
MAERIEVEAYSGYKAEEKPRAFVFRGQFHRVCDIERVWHQEDLQGKRKVFFKVRAEDGRVYEISHYEVTGEWFLERIL